MAWAISSVADHTIEATVVLIPAPFQGLGMINVHTDHVFFTLDLHEKENRCMVPLFPPLATNCPLHEGSPVLWKDFKKGFVKVYCSTGVLRSEPIPCRIIIPRQAISYLHDKNLRFRQLSHSYFGHISQHIYDRRKYEGLRMKGT